MFDSYDRRARLTPGLLAGLPVAFLVSAVGWTRFPVASVAAGLATAAGVTYLVAAIVRQQGRRIEPGLWASWGGPPTTRKLRLREITTSPLQRDPWRKAVQEITHVELRSAEMELSQPEAADELIEVAVQQLLPFGHAGSAYPLVRAENAAYGFERNLWAIRTFGRCVAALCLCAAVVALLSGLVGGDLGDDGGASLLILAMIESTCLAAWILAPSQSRLQDAADRYATQLLNAAVAEAHQIASD